jgi:hypothetical protein
MIEPRSAGRRVAELFPQTPAARLAAIVEHVSHWRAHF